MLPRGGGNHKPVVDQHLPYELRALEAGLSTALRVLEHEVADVEGRTVPALRSLLYERVSRRELTIVRHCRLTLSRLADRLKALKTVRCSFASRVALGGPALVLWTC